jgi:hypothetical protein
MARKCSYLTGAVERVVDKSPSLKWLPQRLASRG